MVIFLNGRCILINFKKNSFKQSLSNVVIKKRALKKKINAIINNIPENLSELELIRYLYLSLGKILVSNTNYYYNSNSEAKKQIFENNKDNFFLNTNEIICNSTELFTYLLKQFGIEAETFYSTEEIHAETIVFSSNNKMYSFNLIGDLSRIQTNRQTKNFAKDRYPNIEIQEMYEYPCSILSDEELKTIDDKLGYTFHGLYTDDFISMLKKDISENINSIIPSDISFESEYDKNESISKLLLEFLLNRCNILNEQLSPVGFTEVTHYYWNLFSEIFPRRFFNKINMHTCFFEGKISNKEMISIISFSHKNSYIYYMFNRNIREICTSA